jgi:hypothetical protein
MSGTQDDRQVIDELAVLADELLEQAAEIRRQWAELAEVLGAEVPEPVVEDAPAPVGGGASADTPDPVRLVALDMVLSGRSRDEVRDYLRATFGEEDCEAVLDDVFEQFG